MTRQRIPARSPAAARKPVWPKVPTEFVRAVLKGHSSLGLVFAALIYLICLTGSLAVFALEFDRWENPTLPRLAAVTPSAAQHAYEAAIARTGGSPEHIYVNFPGGDQTLLSVSVQPKGAPESTVWVADARGNVVGTTDAPWTEFLTTLHINLHLPRTWGEFLVGLIGVALLSSLISGLLAHPRIFRDAFHLRLGGSRRLQEADLHNRLGIWALPFHVTISLTGALLGLTTLIVGVLGLAVFHGDTSKVYALFLPPEGKPDPRAAPAPKLLPLIARTMQLDPGGRIDSIFVDDATEMGGSVQVRLDDGSNRIANTDVFTFNRAGRLIQSKRAANNNLGESILGSIGRLHFGWFGGGIVKVAYGLLGLGLTYLAASGVMIWLARRRDKGRPAPGWERIWTAFVWGQPMALAASALAVLLAPASWTGIALGIWAAVTVAALLATTLLDTELLSRSGKLGTGALLVGTALVHAISRPSGDPIGWTVDGTLAVAGLALGIAALRSKAIKASPATRRARPAP